MKSRIALAAGVAALSYAATAAATDPGTYVSLGAGITIPNSTNALYKIPATFPGTEAQTTYKSGWNVTAAVGYKFDQGFRTELETGYRRATIDQIATTQAAGHQGTTSVMANGLFDIGEGHGFQPYIGGGVGIGWNSWTNVSAGPSTTLPTGTPIFNGTSANFQYQGIVGVDFTLKAQVDMFVDYRFIGTIKDSYPSVTPAGSVVNLGNNTSHNILLGVRYSFGAK